MEAAMAMQYNSIFDSRRFMLKHALAGRFLTRRLGTGPTAAALSDRVAAATVSSLAVATIAVGAASPAANASHGNLHSLLRRSSLSEPLI